MEGPPFFFAGSANITDAAFDGNVEILLELEGAKKDLGIEAIMGSDGMQSILLPHAASNPPCPPVDDLGDRLEAAVRALASVMLTSAVVQEVGFYRMEVQSTEPMALPSPMKASLELPTVPGQSVELLDATIAKASLGPLRISDITAWLILRVSEAGMERSTTVKARLINDPADRLSAVLASQIDSTEKFLMFLSLLLQLENSSWFDQLPTDGTGSGSFGLGSFGQRGLFESMVRPGDQPQGPRVHRRPDHEAADRRSGSCVIPRELIALWPAFASALATIEAG